MAQFATGTIAHDRNVTSRAKHEITAQTEYITALLLAPLHRLPQHNDAIRGGILAFHYRMQIYQEV